MSKTSSVVAIWIAALSLFSIAGPRLCADDIVAHPSKLKFDEVQFTAPKRAAPRHEIAGGVVAYVVEDRSLPLVDISVLVRTGSYLDPKGKEGLAEIVGELLRSGGTSKLSPNEFDEEIDFLAAQVSSSIGDERGSASLNCLTKDVDRVLELFFDMLRRPRFDSARFDVTRRRVLQNLARRNDSTASIESREWERLLRGDTHYSNDLVTTTSIESITKNDLAAFHGAYFHPRNFIFAVSGDVDTNEILAKLSKHLEGWTSLPEGAPRPPAPGAPAEPGVYIVDKPDVNQGRVRLGHVGVHRSHPDYHPLRIMNHVLGGGGFTSRIMSRVRSDEGLAYTARSSLSFGTWHPQDGAFLSYFQSKSPSVAHALDIVIEEIDRIRNEEVSAAELAGAISYSVNVFPRFFARPDQIADTFASDEFSGRDDSFWHTFRDKVRAVTTADVQRVARKHLDPKQLVVLIVGQRKEILAGDPDKPQYSIEKISESIGAGKVVHSIPLPDPRTLLRKHR